MEKNILLEEIINKFDLYKGERIRYDEFINMYNEYSDKLTEVEFADLLGVRRKVFIDFKNLYEKYNKRKLTILANRNLSEKEKVEKILEIIEKYNLNKGKKIEYTFFKEMLGEVKTELTEVEFANLLGISDSNLRHSRNSNMQMRIFKNCKLDNEKIEMIRKQIIQKYEGKRTYYKSNENNKGTVDFLELYKPYKIYFSEKEFADLLGISEKNLWYVKNKIGNPQIKDIEKRKKIEGIKSELEKMIYLGKNEIEEMCQKLEISVDDFIIYYINNGNFFETDIYRYSLNVNNGIWTRKGKIEETDANKYAEMFIKIAQTATINVKKDYNEKNYEEDIQYNTLLYILENCSDLVKNFKYDLKLMEKMIWFRARQYAKIQYILELQNNSKKTSYNDATTSSKNITNNSRASNIEIEKNDIDDEQLIDIFKEYLTQGYSKEIILKKLSKILNIKSTEIIERMKKCLIEKGQVKQNDDGAYEIGE